MFLPTLSNSVYSSKTSGNKSLTLIKVLKAKLTGHLPEIT
jgi:hypothetical protein